jgi:hypothetical protein
VCPPKYDPERYRSHYFRPDFTDLLTRFTETIDEQDQARRDLRSKEDKEQREIRDFIPYKVAKRIKEFVSFSVKLDGRSTDLRLDDATKSLLDGMDDKKNRCEVDSETIPVLKEYKLNQMRIFLQEAVDRKYKISFCKGVQLALESLIVFILMVSVVMKANIFSLIYLIFVFKFLLSREKVMLLVRLVQYMAILFVI